MTRRLGPGECTFCRRRVLWLQLLSNAWRTFETQEFTLDDVGEAGGWVAKRTPSGTRAVPVAGEKHPPAKVLTPHVCTQYREAKLDERLGVKTMGADWSFEEGTS